MILITSLTLSTNPFKKLKFEEEESIKTNEISSQLCKYQLEEFRVNNFKVIGQMYKNEIEDIQYTQKETFNEKPGLTNDMSHNNAH